MKIAFITGSRAEFGITKGIVGLLATTETDCGYIVCGSHINEGGPLPSFAEIEASGLPVFDTIPTRARSDDSLGICSEIGDLIPRVARAIQDFDAVFLTGDRFETFAVAVSAHTLGIPILHLHGGELSLGAIDDGYRHSISKLAKRHYTSTDNARQRLIKMGEDPQSIIHCGAPALETLLKTKVQNRSDFLERFGIASPFALTTIHPVTNHRVEAHAIVDCLAKIVPEFPDLSFLVSMPNNDTEGRSLRDKLVALTSERIKLVENLGIELYASALTHAEMLLGNSSSGIIEAASFDRAVINIGNRQFGRERSGNTIDVQVEQQAICEAIIKAREPAFRAVCQNAPNVYYRENSIETIVEDLTQQNFTELRKFKTFYE